MKVRIVEGFLRMDVFISYSSRDRALVEETCALLRKSGISYWVAFENDDYGDHYSSSIISNLDDAKMVLLFVTKDSNTSEHVLREINYADNHHKPILPVLVGEVVLSKEFEYYLSATHFLSYSSTSVFSKQLVKRIHEILFPVEQNKEGTRLAAEAYKPKGKGRRIPFGIAAVAAVLVLGAVVWLGILWGNSEAEKPQEPEHSAGSDSQLETPSADQKEEAPQETPMGENQIPAQLQASLEAFDHQQSMIVDAMTLRMAVGGKATPMAASIWAGSAIYSENTAVAVGENGMVVGIAKGETHVVVVSPQGSTQIYKVIVE